MLLPFLLGRVSLSEKELDLPAVLCAEKAFLDPCI